MAFFKSRQSGDSSSPSARQPESVEVLRRRAKHRLMGSVVLVLAGVVGFPLLFDSQPRPVPVDIQIDMPDKAKVAPLQIPPSLEAPNTPTASASVVPGVVGGSIGGVAVATAAKSPESKVVPTASLGDKEQIVGKEPTKPDAKLESKPDVRPEPKAEKKPEPKPASKQEPKAEVKSDAKPVVKNDDGARAKALLEGKSVTKDSSKDSAKESKEVKDSKTKSPDTDLRLVIQVGAFAEADKAHEVRLKLEHAGLKTYTHVAETKEGKRIRVRVGPFSTHAEADKVANKVKALQLPASILTL